MMKHPAALILFIFSLLVISCAHSENAGIVFEKSPVFIQPGLTAKIGLAVYFSDTEIDPQNLPDGATLSPDRKSVKLFDNPPVVSISDASIVIVDTDYSCTAEGITAEITVSAPEGMLSGHQSILTVVWQDLSARADLIVRKDPSGYIDADGVIIDAGAFDELVNKQRRLPADYIPDDLVRVEVPTILSFDEVNHLRLPASEALCLMFEAAKKEKGFELLARSGYRSYKTQVSLFDLNVREYGSEFAARISAQPGTSEHQSGLAMDISSPAVNYQLTQDFGETGEGLWVAKNAHRFGFIVRYPRDKEDITGYTYEPWHLRWVGEELAEYLYSRDLCLEEFFAL